MSIEYDQYLREHIAAVNDALRWMADNVRVPYITETDFNDAIWNATDHDKSKYDKEEYDAYDEYFYGGNRSYQVVEDFNYAWLHHQNTNKHHWQYWVLIRDDPMESEEALTMPIPYILEMIADWWSFSWRKGNLFEIFDWYIENEKGIILNPDTRHVVEDILNTIRTVLEMQERVKGRGEDYLEHHGILGQKWGVRRFQNPDGTRTELGKAKEREHTVFVSGSSKTQDATTKYYRGELPKDIKSELDNHMTKGNKIIVGDAPGIDRQVQDYLNDADYDNVEVYGPGKRVRYSANSKWKTNAIDDPDHEEGSKEWLAKKDKAMSDAADEGLAVILDEGSTATRKNIERMLLAEKDVKVFELNKNGEVDDGWSIINQEFKARRNVLNKKLDADFDQELVDLFNMEILADLGLYDDLEAIYHSDIDDKKYGVPELKKFPMPDAKHVRSAIKFFNYVDPKHEEKLAKAILARMDEYGLTFDDFGVGDENRFKKYIPKK